MKYTKEERIDIGRQVCTQEISHKDAELKYGVGKTSIDKYIKAYKIAAGIPTKARISKTKAPVLEKKGALALDIEAYKAMSKDELINELIKAKVNEARAKKGYEVKGDGTNKEYISLSNRNLKS